MMKASAILTALLLNSVVLPAQERITLLFAGDLMQHKAQIEAARTPQGGYDYSPCFHAVRPMIEAADIAVGNLEVPFGGKPYTGYPAFSAPDEYLHAIRHAGFDLLLTANNHCLDRGKRGLERTIALLDSLSIPYLGTYRNERERHQRHPLLIEKKGFRIAFLNYTYGTNGIPTPASSVVNRIDTTRMKTDILHARALRPDAIIACMHWGTEYKSLPSGEQRSLARWLIRQGVTHVIGAHPHVIQPMEVQGSWQDQHVVVYSLGNFISNMSAPDTDGGAMVTLELEKIGPLCRVADCHYQLVWTLRPKLSGRRNFELLLATHPADSLPPAARNRLINFKKRAIKLLDNHNIGIAAKD